MSEQTPWYHRGNTLKRLEEEITEYFKLFYQELRYLASDDYDSLPSWVKGQRTLWVKTCTDGVLISHRYPNTLPDYKPAKPDEDGDLFRWGVFFAHRVAQQLAPELPTRSDGQRFALPNGGPQLEHGRVVGVHVELSPVVNINQREQREVLPHLWTRLEWAGAYEAIAGRWRDTSVAQEEAEYTMHFARNWQA